MSGTGNSHAIVIGSSISGLLTARVLAKHYDQVTIVERDCLPEQPQARPGVPQASHVHALLTRGLEILLQLFPGLETELVAAGAVKVDWINDWLLYGIWGLAPRFASEVQSYTCSRHLLEWLIYSRLKEFQNIQWLQATQVTGLLFGANQYQVIGVKLRSRNQAKTQNDYLPELKAELVVDATGRNSLLPKWLETNGYDSPKETVINSFLGYASRWYQQTENSEFDYQGIIISAQPPKQKRGGVIYPVEGNRWVVTLSGIARDYPPTDETEFLEFARSLQSPIIYETIKNAQPLSEIYSFRATENRLRHYEKLSKYPEGLLAVGDAVCAFNPVYGQGMTVAAIGALTLDECLSRKHNSNYHLSRHYYKQLAQQLQIPWLMATGEDLRWSTTSGGQLNVMSRFIQGYLDQVIRLGVDSPQLHQRFIQIAHLVKPPSALFAPPILLQVLLSLPRERMMKRLKQLGVEAIED